MATAVLLSGGLDSAVLVADEAASGEVQPIYVSVGLAWESAERAVVSSFLAAAHLNGRVRPLVSLGVDMRDVYAATHWAMAGTPPAYHTPARLPSTARRRRSTASPSVLWRTIRFLTRRRHSATRWRGHSRSASIARCGSTHPMRLPKNPRSSAAAPRSGSASSSRFRA